MNRTVLAIVIWAVIVFFMIRTLIEMFLEKRRRDRRRRGGYISKDLLLFMLLLVFVGTIIGAYIERNIIERWPHRFGLARREAARYPDPVCGWCGKPMDGESCTCGGWDDIEQYGTFNRR